MTIADQESASKPFLGRIPDDVLVVLVILLSATAAFGLGILAGKDMNKAEGSDGFWIEQLPQEAVKGGGGPASAAAAVSPAPVPAAPPVPEVRTYVASRNGTKYYLPACGSAKRIKEENRVWFATKEEAEGAGYGPAANCPGL